MRALELGVRDGDGPVPPRLRRFVGFHKVTDPALRAVRRTLDEDDAFRRRVRRVLEDDGGAAVVGDAGWLLVARPPGWEEELATLLAAESEEAAHAKAAREEERAARQRERLSRELRASRAALDDVQLELGRMRDALAAERRARAELEHRLTELAADRTDAVRKLKAEEERSAERAGRLRAAEDELARARVRLDALTAAAPPGAVDLPAHGAVGPAARSEPPAAAAGAHLATSPASDSPASAEVVSPGAAPVDAPRVPVEGSSPPAVAAGTSWGDPEAARRHLADAAAAAASLADALAGLAALVPSSRAEDVPSDRGLVEPARAEPRRSVRRRPLPVPVGLFDDSAEAAAQWLHHPGAAVLVDGWNVAMAGWPDLGKSLQRRRLVECLRALESVTGAAFTVVFDSALDERTLPPASVPRSVQVRFAPVGTTADEELLRAVDGHPPERPVIVVTSDREVADGARERGANVIPTSALLALVAGA